MSKVTMTCSGCGSEYELTKYKIIIRDRDTIDCKVCGTELKRWNGAEMWTSELVTKKEPSN